MVILHIARVTQSVTSGVDVVVPQHIASQSQYATVGFVNLYNYEVPSIKHLQLSYDNVKTLPNCLPSPFDKPDLVVIHETNNINHIKYYRNMLKAGIPYIIVPHGELTKSALSKKRLKKKVAYFLFFNKFIRKAKAIQCLSEAETDNIVIKTPIKFIGTNGVYNLTDKKSTFSDNGVKLLYLGRLEMAIKGLDRILNAMSIIKNYCLENNVTLDIYGPDVYNRREILQQYIDEKELGDIVKIHDPVYGEDKFEVIKSCDVFVQTSRSEGMPVGILEVMNLGVPCFLTKGTCLSEILVDYNAGYYAGESDDDIAKNLILACESTDKKERGENAIKLVEENYLWDTVTKKNIEIYKNLVNINV